MAFFKLAVPAMALANVALAQDVSCSVEATATITGSAVAQSIAACTTFSGSVAMATDLSGPVSLDGALTEIDGSLIGDTAGNVTSLSASSLERITGDFTLTSMLLLGDVTFNALSNIGGALNWVTLPQLEGLTFNMGVQRISDLTIRDTQIFDLSVINVKSAKSISIANNKRLSALSWQLSEVDGDIYIDSNGSGDGFNATFGNLASANSISINTVNNLVMNSLKNLTGTLDLQNTTAEFFQFPNLTMSGTITIANNSNLNNISFPVLNRIKSGGLTFELNPALTDDVTFPSLQRIDSALHVSGAFNEFLLPKIQTIVGDVDVESSGSLDQTCGAVNNYRKSGIIDVTPVCKGENKASGASGTNGSGSGGTTSEAAAANVVIPSAITLGSLVAAIFGLL